MFKSIFVALALSFSAENFAKVSNPVESSNMVRHCYGNEPFWSLEINDETIELKSESSVKSIATPSAKAAIGRPLSFISMYQGRTIGNNNAFMNVIIKKETCSDRMADEQQPFSVIILSGNTLLEGCCSR